MSWHRYSTDKSLSFIATQSSWNSWILLTHVSNSTHSSFYTLPRIFHAILKLLKYIFYFGIKLYSVKLLYQFWKKTHMFKNQLTLDNSIIMVMQLLTDFKCSLHLKRYNNLMRYWPSVPDSKIEKTYKKDLWELNIYSKWEWNPSLIMRFCDFSNTIRYICIPVLYHIIIILMAFGFGSHLP